MSVAVMLAGIVFAQVRVLPGSSITQGNSFTVANSDGTYRTFVAANVSQFGTDSFLPQTSGSLQRVQHGGNTFYVYLGEYLAYEWWWKRAYVEFYLQTIPYPAHALSVSFYYFQTGGPAYTQVRRTWVYGSQPPSDPNWCWFALEDGPVVVGPESTYTGWVRRSFSPPGVRDFDSCLMACRAMLSILPVEYSPGSGANGYRDSMPPYLVVDWEPVGISENVAAPSLTDLTVVPNPAFGHARLHWQGQPSARAALTVTDAAGREVLAMHLELSRGQAVDLDLGTLPAGVYLARLVAPALNATRKFVINP